MHIDVNRTKITEKKNRDEEETKFFFAFDKVELFTQSLKFNENLLRTERFWPPHGDIFGRGFVAQ